jgi:alpha-aminoadipate carrier protein LysW
MRRKASPEKYRITLDLLVGKININRSGCHQGEAIMVLCPECDTDLDIDEDEVDEGEIVSCPECGTDFEIVTVSPIELKPVEEEIEDDDEEPEAEDGDFS